VINVASETVGFGVIGLGMGNVRARCIHETQGAKLVAVAELNEERGQKAASEYGVEWYKDYRQLLDRSDIDVINVMTPSGTHADFAIEAARAGKHVITTKPIEVTLDRADQMINACHEAGVILAIDFEARYMAENVRVKQAVDEGRLGRMILGEVRLKWFRNDAYYEGWHGTWQYDGGGALINQSVHQIDLLVWYMGAVESVQGQIGVFNHDIETEDLGMAMIRFRSGAVGMILGTTTCPVTIPAAVELHGTKGLITTSGNGIDTWHLPNELKEDSFSYDGPQNVIEDMIQLVRFGGKPLITGEEAKKSLALVLAIYESSRTGDTITL
tara:strand:- start:20657 stop:21640 length:984 start_codon:yes stop_codon:yes gene_type:complete